MSKRSGTGRLGSLATAAITAIALAVQAGLAAVVGVIIAREFGRTAETDGFFTAYGVFIVLALASNAIRLVVLPPLARARDGRRLGQEAAAWALILGALSAPLVFCAFVFAAPLGDLLTGSGPHLAAETAAHTLPLVVLAGVGQIFAGLAASALAALDDYLTAAVAYIVASVAGLLTILLRVDTAGVDAVAVGMVVNAFVACGLQSLVLALRAGRAAMPRSGIRPGGGTLADRARQALRGCSLPLALQGAYLVCVPLAAREGVGAVTSFGYAYLAGSALVAATAASFGLVTAVPLTRAGLDAKHVARHVVATSWLALLAVGAAAGVFAVAGEPILSHVLGTGFLGSVGAEVGQLVAMLAPWMIASIGIAVGFPLMFVARHERALPLISLATLAAQVPLALVGQRLFGLTGLAFALAGSAAVAFVGFLRSLHATRATLVGLARAVAVVSVIAAPIFLVADVVFANVVAAVVGLVTYGVAIAVIRPAGLVDSLHYLRSLG